MRVRLQDGEREFPDGVSALDIAGQLSQQLKKDALAADVDGKVQPLWQQVPDGAALRILTFADEAGRRVLRHTASHVLAQAVKTLFPDAKLAIGPAIENGFYYDFDVPQPFTNQDLAALEKEMARIIKRNARLERFVLPRAEAIALMREQGEPYKVELIEDLPEGEELSFYKMEDFVDLCAGPHLPSTGRVKAFKLLQVAGAYWRGSETNTMLQRISGTAFDSQEALDAYLAQLEEAKRRDHNKLGRELELFTTSEVIGQGLPILLPKGARIVQLLQRFVEDEEEKRGYLLTKSPLMAKSNLYKISGHWDHYYDGMFVMGDKEMDARGEEVLALRPMTCPFQFQAYLNRTRSYRDLPLRYNETSTLFRNEASGEMHGLIRVRQFTISEGHLACRQDQVEQEFKDCLDLARYLLDTIGLLEDVSFQFSKWDPNNREKYIGEPEAWESTQALMKHILEHMGLHYTEAEGEAAFYGPKLDIQMRNVHGKEDTLVTIQIDFQLAERFGMVYTDSDGQKKHPVVLHRTSIGCYERTLALLIEKYAGAFPTWLAPVQAKVMTITERGDAWARQVEAALKAEGLRVEMDLRNEKIGFKIREAQMERVPYMLVLGDKEVEQGAVAVRSRKEGDLGTMPLAAIVSKIAQEVREKAR
ncbi:MAG: threonine--tRNA ligase [Oscillospiraceae bacterium]|jgi:threonyl-tRNA synthetase|nr:threonine--tRNA ligase [Oscillospiraceae bacterium]